ncbi:L,D-transpeptidase [Mesorhizobium sp. M1409]|uniref:L,D-transpeptidase n=1 Tax=unclassified Mesorhizobium TaxID=325217 RepID=UPI003338AFEB
MDPGLSKSELESRQRAYANEAYLVKIVDRRKFDPSLKPTIVAAPAGYSAGTVVVDTGHKFLYLVGSDGKAHRYGIAVGATGHAWSGKAVIGRKAEWPAWYPTDDMHAQTPQLPRRIEPGQHNPLGARALYLYQNGVDTLYRIHGTSEPWTIGTEASSGCIRMLNEDIIDLYDRASNGATVVVL